MMATRRVGDDYTQAAAAIEQQAATGKVLTTAERKTLREDLKGNAGEQIMIRLSGQARGWLDMNKVAETEVDAERVPPAQSNDSGDTPTES